VPIAALCLFEAAAVAALKFPLARLGICVCCLVVYLKAEASGGETNAPAAGLVPGP